MNPTQHTSEKSDCSQQRIEQFLRSDHYRIEDADQELIAHLDRCPNCRETIETQAASLETWDLAKQLLHPSEFDCASTALYSAGSSTGVHGTPSVAIQDVLDALAPTDDPHHLGRIGTHEVTGVIGVGGMGVVLKAIDPSLDRVVAIKVMAPRLANNETARKRFAREAKAAAAVLHPNVIPIHSVSADGASPYLVMAYIRGGSLQKRLEKDGPLPLIEILRIGSQIAAGLAAAHDQGLVHRDIKPENILLEEGVERVTITDFGLARAVDDNTVTQQGTIAGTPMYMSPEQARGEQLDQKSDLFSLGSVLYAICTGKPPYRSDNSYGVMRKIIDESPAPVRELNPVIPEWMALVVEKLMAKDKADRFASATEVHKLLEACLSHVQQPAMFAVPPIPGVLPDWPRTPFLKTRLGVLTMSLFTTAAMLCVAVISQTDRPSLTVYGPTPPVAAASTGENSIAIVPSLTVEGHTSEGADGKGKTQTHRWKLKGQSVGNMTVRLLRIENGKSHVVSESVYSGQDAGGQAIEVELQLEGQDQPLPTAGATFIPTMAVSVNGLQSKSPSGEAFTLSGEAPVLRSTDQRQLSSSHVLMHSVQISEAAEFAPTVDYMQEASNTGTSFLAMVLDWHSVDEDSTDQSGDEYEIETMETEIAAMKHILAHPGEDSIVKDFNAKRMEAYRQLIKEREAALGQAKQGAMQKRNTDDHKNLQGTWQVTYSEEGGKAAPQGIVDRAQIVFAHEKMMVSLGGCKIAYSFKLNPSTSPKSIDLTYQGQTVKGIYEFQGDTLQIRNSLQPNGPRPSTFEPEPGSPTDTVFKMKRVQDVAAKMPDQDTIQGIWLLTKQVTSGKSAPQGITDRSQMIFSNQKMTMVLDDCKTPYAFQLDPNTSPKSIVLTYRGKTMQGIYELQGDELRIRSTEDPQDERPTTFDPAVGSKNNTFFTMKRVKDVAAKVPDQEQPVTKLSDLKDGDYFLQVTQFASHPQVQFPSEVIPDKAYGPADGEVKTIRLQFLDQDARVRIIDHEMLGWSKVPVWTRTKSPAEWTYENDTGESDNGMGKLFLKQKEDALVATIDVHGSGFPILFSCRGSLVEINEANRAQVEANAIKTLQLEDGGYEFQVSHIAEDPGVKSLDSLIPDADYKPVTQPTSFQLQFSSKTFSVKIKDGRTPAKIGGKGVAKKEQPWEHLMVYEISGEGFEPGELIVQKSGRSLAAYYKVSGPGVPVLAGYRGTLVKADHELADQPRAADAVQETLPIGRKDNAQ